MGKANAEGHRAHGSRTRPPSTAALAASAPLLGEWARLWGVPGLEKAVRVELSARLRVSLGRALPARRTIRLAPALLEGPEPLLREVLCHEFAHCAVHEGHGAAARPHGREWRALMQAAGFVPRVRVPRDELPEALRVAEDGGQVQRWVHRCPVCQARRVAARVMRRWRCPRCVALGLGGELVVEPLRGTG